MIFEDRITSLMNRNMPVKYEIEDKGNLLLLELNTLYLLSKNKPFKGNSINQMSNLH